MKKKLLLVAGGILGLVGVAAIYAALQPPQYEISRRITIQAPMSKIFPYLNNSKLADQWGPWKEEDPETKMIFSGPEAGVGSTTSWEEGKKLGTGSATIVESITNERVGIRLEYVKPIVMSQYAEYLMQASPEGTVVTWRVKGENTFPYRFMCLFLNMDKMVGSMFERGLSNLKSLAEKG